MQTYRSMLGAGLAAAVASAGGIGAWPEPGEGQMRQRAREAARRQELAARPSPGTEQNRPGETNRQFAQRMRSERAAIDTPTKPKRVRTKKASA